MTGPEVHETMLFHDHLACGHSVLVEVLVPIDPVWRCNRDVGSYSFCGTCPPRQGDGRYIGGPALSEIVSTDHVLAPGVWADGKGELHLDLTAMCESAGYEATEENKATLIEAARTVWPDIPVEVDP